MSILLSLGDAADDDAVATQGGSSNSPRSISVSQAQPGDATPIKPVTAPSMLPEKPASVHEHSAHAQGSPKKANQPIPVPPSRPTKGRTPSLPSSPSPQPSPLAEASSASPPTASPHLDRPNAGAESAALNSTKAATPASLILLPGTPPPGSEDPTPHNSTTPSPRGAEGRDRAHTVAAPSSAVRLSGKAFAAETSPSNAAKAQAAADGRVLPARPVAMSRRPNRPGAQTARGNLFTAAAVPEEPVDKPQQEHHQEHHVHFEDQPFKSREFEDVLSKPSLQSISEPSSPRDASSDTHERVPSSFDPKNPFEIEEMAQHVDSPKVSHSLRARPPAPPTITEPQTPPPRPVRGGSAPFTSSQQRVIPKPPSTTPATIAPLVVPRIPVAVEGHHNLGHGHHIEDAEKKAKRERKEAGAINRPPVPPKRVHSSSQLSASTSTITPSSSASSLSAAEYTETEASASESASAVAITAVPVLTPNPVFELHPEQTAVSPRSGLSKSIDVVNSKKVTSPAASPLASSAAIPPLSLDKNDKKEKSEKHEKKERPSKEKDEKKDEKKSGILSMISSKLTLRGKKHDKSHEFEPVEEESESDSQSGPPDPLLAPQLSPAVTPRGGLMSLSSPEDGGSEELELALAHLPAASAGEAGVPVTEGQNDVSELETHMNVLLAQIRNMEDLHRRLRDAIAEEQSTLASSRKGGRSRSRSTGTPVAHSSISQTPPTKRKDKIDKSDKSDKKEKESSTVQAAATPLSPRSKPTTPITSSRVQTPVTANNRQKFPNVAGFKIPKGGDVKSVFGFQQKLAQSDSRGDVYCCRHTQSGLLVTVRVAPAKDETQYEAIRSRSAAMVGLENERLATVMHAQIVAGELWLVSQYCPIGSLQTMLETHALTLGEDSIRVIARSVLVALSFLHRSKLTHGSLSLSNILVDSYADVKLCDYSLHTLFGEAISTAPFDSQCRADLHALSVILVQMAEWELIPLHHEASSAVVLSNPSKFTNEFNAFIEACSFADQPAAALLSHPFLAAHVSSQPLVDAVANALLTLRNHSPTETNVHPTLTREELDERYKSKALSPAISKIRIHERNESSNSDSAEQHSDVTSPAAAQNITNLKSKIDESIEKALVGASEEAQKLVQQLRAAIFQATEEVLAPAPK